LGWWKIFRKGLFPSKYRCLKKNLGEIGISPTTLRILTIWTTWKSRGQSADMVPPVQSSGECVSCIHPITLQVKQLLVNQTSGAEWAEARGKSSMKNTRAEQFGCAKSAVSCPCLL